MPYRDPFLEQDLIDQGDVNQLFGQPQAPMVKPPMSGMQFGIPKRFSFNDPQMPPAPISPDTQRAIDATNRVAGVQPTADARRSAPTDLSAFLGTGTKLGMGKRDEQELAALGPEYIAAARELGDDPSSRQNVIRGRNETTGQDFVATPGNRVSRDALRGVAERVAMQKLKQEGIDAEARQFGQKRELAALPGEQKKDLFRLASDAERAKDDIAFQRSAPEREQKMAMGKQALAEGDLSLDQKRFDASQRNDPKAKQMAAADQQMERLAAMPQTPAVRALQAQLYPFTSIGSRVPSEVASGFGSELTKSPNQRATDVLQLPAVQRLLGGAVGAGGELAGKVEGMTANPFNILAYTPESALTDIESQVERAVQAALREDPALDEGALREQITQQLEGKIGAGTNVGRRLRRAGQKRVP